MTLNKSSNNKPLQYTKKNQLLPLGCTKKSQLLSEANESSCGLFDTGSWDEQRVNRWSTVQLQLIERKEASGGGNKAPRVWCSLAERDTKGRMSREGQVLSLT